MDSAVIGLLGVLVGGIVSTGTTFVRPRIEAQRRREDALRNACADFSAALIRIRYLSEGFASLSSSAEPGLVERIQAAHQDAQVAFEHLRLLSRSTETQRAGRFALRHVWAIWKEAQTGVDPREAEYAPESPHMRFNRELKALYVATRQETGMKPANDVFPEPEDRVGVSLTQ